MNPLSPLTYYRRHKRRSLLLIGLISLATLGVCIMVRLLDSSTEQYKITESYLTRFGLVYARGDAFEPGVVSQIRAHPDVERVIPAKSMFVELSLLGAFPSNFPLFGVSENELQETMELCDLRLKEGRLLRPRTDQVMLSEELTEALDLHLGDRIGRPIDKTAYASIPETMELVGILESEPGTDPGRKVRLGLASYEYLESHELTMDLPPELLVVAREGRKAAVEQFLESTVASPRTEVWTERRVSRSIANALTMFHLIFGAVDILVAVAIALVVGAINQIAITHRIQDFGLLNAVGYRKSWLIRRLALEMLAVAGAGWLTGLGLAWLVFWWLKEHVFGPGMELDLANLTPIWFAALIPLAAIASVTYSTARIFARLDAVAIIDRGRLGAGAGDHRRLARRSRVPHSSARPLSSWTFYRRHARRGLTLTLTIALTILGVAFPVLLFSPMIDADRLRYEYLRRVTLVSPIETAVVDPGVTAQIRLHPDVDRVVPAMTLGLSIDVPPFNRNYITLFGVPEDELQALVELYGAQVEEGRLPRPRTNEIVVSKAIAMNRGLHVGDRVGKPVYELDNDLHTEMVVVGILSRPSAEPTAGDVELAGANGMGWKGFMQDPREQGLWLGFASYEYLSSHELYAFRPVSLIVVPKEGHRAELDAWLKESAASEQTAVRTYSDLIARHRQDIKNLFLLLAVVEGVIAFVAAVALAILSYIFFIQRREEFGILSAIGHSRRWLVLRTLGESVAVVAVAWLMGAAFCLAGLIFMQLALFIPKGMALDFSNPAPWVATLPLPLAIIVVSAGLVVWMLSKLDPVSIIEGR